MSHKRHKIKERELKGFKYFKTISKILESLHDVGCQGDLAVNRILHMDQYFSLLLLHMFNPICMSLRSLQQADTLKGCRDFGRNDNVVLCHFIRCGDTEMRTGVSALEKLLEQSAVRRINRRLRSGYRDTSRGPQKEKADEVNEGTSTGKHPC